MNGQEYEAGKKEMAGIWEGLENGGSLAEKISSLEEARERIIFQVVSAGAKNLLMDMPHRVEGKLAFVYRLFLELKENEVCTVKIDHDVMRHLGGGEEELYQNALVNTPRLLPPIVRRINDLCKELMPDDMEWPTCDQDSKVYVLTNRAITNGAAAIFYPEIKESMAERMGGSYFVIPSSIHETIIVPDDGHANVQELREMLNTINETEVAPEEVLAQDVYRFDSKTGRLHLAEGSVGADAPNKPV